MGDAGLFDGMVGVGACTNKLRHGDSFLMGNILSCLTRNAWNVRENQDGMA